VRRRGPRWLIAVLTAGIVVLVGGGPAAAAPARPTADPAAPTPTTPWSGLPPQGTAPDGSTVGGEELDTRGIVVADGTPPLPVGLAASAWLVADAGSGEVLAARDPHGRYYPASTLKTLTLLTLAPVLDHGLVVEGTTDDEAVEGSRVGLVHGGQYPVDLLFRALVMQSGNDAANALARAAGGVQATLAAMNTTAERIGAFDTVAGTPSGLDVAGQSSSPYDLALIMRQLVADPYTLDVLQTRTAQMPAVADLTPGYQIQSQDTLLDSYPGTLGGKTGFTDAARHTFVAAAERNGRRLVVSLMQAERRPVPELQQAVNLLDWGFSTAPDASGLGRLVDPGEVSAVSPPTVPTPTAAADGRLSADEAASASAATARPSPRPVAQETDPGSPVVPFALAGVALLIVAATVLGVRRALHPVAVPPAAGPGPATGSPAHPPGPRPRAGRGPGAPAPDPTSQPGPGAGRPPAAPGPPA
jgi:serine-type D-Ala-D-Ala carboxypeptidase (penicillin-binding protein 5/6)